MGDDLLTRFPLDGPHTPQRIVAAGNTVAELVRYLNHATMPNNASDALPYPADLAKLVGHLATAVERMPQLLQQLGVRLDAMREMRLYVSDGADLTVVMRHADRATCSAAVDAEALAATLKEAGRQVDRLGVGG